MVSKEPIYATWYVMEDGTYGDPREISLGNDGALAHGKSGLKVAMRDDGVTPRSRGVEVDDKGDLAEAQPKAKDIAADDKKPGYKTRDQKAK